MLSFPTTTLLDASDTERYLAPLGLAIGNWNEILDTSVPAEEVNWISYEAPQNARNLLRFAWHLSGWLPKGDWKLLQFDNSNLFEGDQTSLIGRLLFGQNSIEVDMTCVRTVLFKFVGSEQEKNAQELLLTNLIFSILLVEGHAYVVSSKSTEGQVLGLQDGIVYFSSRNTTASAHALVRAFEQRSR
jgi:hypothetical protein